MGSNGLTMARHDVLSSFYKKFAESFDPQVPDDLVYTGSLKLTEQISENPLNVGKMILSPTRTFSPIIKEIFENYFDKIDGMVHCTGGGQTKVLHFVKNLRIIKNNLFKTPPLFSMIQSQSNSQWHEMYKVFNMGNLLEFYTDEITAQSLISLSQKFNIEAQIVGYVEAAEKNELIVTTENGEFVY